ncbi:tetratricopeptide repeat-containing sensor histidine kinase [Flavobacterium sp.]|uniref:tetratricopeptide repeat-containing sensor histidine kinase n=3 Tax=Flavobacterium sp. TaxID=239 RepID=UPI00403466C4
MKILKYLALLCAVFSSVPSFSQTKLLDSLFTELKHPKDEKEKAVLLNAISAEYENEPEQMLRYARQAMEVSHKAGLKQYEADSWRNIGNANIILSKYTQALKSFTNSQSLYESLVKSDPKNNDHKDGLANVYGSIGIVCSEQNNYAKGLEYYFKALKLFRETGQEEIVAIVYNNIGDIYSTQKEYTKALEYFNKALWIQKKTGDPSSAITISNIGKIYLAKDEDEKALQSFNEAEAQFGKFENNRGLAELYNNFGNFYRKKNDLPKAVAYYNKALDIFERSGEKYGAASSLTFLGNIYVLEGKTADAIANLERSSALAEEIGVLEQVKESEKALSDIYEKMGNAGEALLHYKKYTAAKDKIINSENIKNIVREEMNYEFERKAALQKVEDEKRQVLYDEQAKRHVQQMVFIGLSALLLFGIAFLIYSRLQLKKRLTLQRDLAEYEQKALHLQMNPHFVFNCLGSISSFIVQNGTDQAIKYLSKFSKLMRLTLEYSKESLIPIDKEIESLQNYLELEQLRFNNMFEFEITKDPNIEDDMALPPLLLQPFVENSIIHGIVPKKMRGRITVGFKLEGEKLICTVTDDGIGINRSKKLKEASVTVHKSMAMEITRKRLEVIQAVTSRHSQVEIKEITNATGEPAGTRIILHLPVQYANN